MTKTSPPARAVLGAGLAVALAAGAGAMSPAGAEEITFQLDWVPGGDKAFIYAGVQQGFFADEDIEIEVVSAAGSADAIDRIAAGASDLGVTGLGALMSHKVESPGLPVTAVMSVFTDPPHALFTTADTGIADLADVAGATVGTVPFSSSNVYWPLILGDNGVDPGSVTMINAEPGALGPMLATGRIDAAIMWVTNQALLAPLVAEAERELVMIPWSDYGLEIYSTCLIASDALIAENPDLLRRFTRAFARSIAFVRETPRAGVAALAAAVPDIDVEVAEGQLRAALALMADDVTETAGFGVLEPARLAETWAWVARAQGFAPGALDPEAVVDRSFMPTEAM